MSISERQERSIVVGLCLIVIALVLSLALFVRSTGNKVAKMYTATDKIAAGWVHLPPPLPYTFPNGGRALFPGYRLVALYGTPGDPALGVLGEQSATATISRIKGLAAQYQPLVSEHILPTMEMITTVASAFPTDNNDYSQEVDPSILQAWITEARKDGVYVVLDLQSGRTDFLSQAKQYQALLAQPNVGLALDPEWRLTPSEVPLQQIGTVNITEINGVADWLATLVKTNRLPQKLLLLHQFRADMIINREKLDTSHPELAYAIQMDGQGTQPEKRDSWHDITASPPANVRFGWKNFYKQDHPTLSPELTMQLNPKPWYVSYQ